ncbi:hypothetical protein EDB92DRAFT_1952876 [Lactarius akahatsu]|uniref:DUF6532 domain-containing protein n=1 Tax=Lactarius akahatsu TaxID=416441 RepID=A0AAD4L7U0_9AGAM|nr:hypothetical protein EDB92DRAFT_1952876 [Lactarius akahatsu]
MDTTTVDTGDNLTDRTSGYLLMSDEASEIEMHGVSKFVLSREYRRSMMKDATRMSDKDIDEYFTAQRPGFETDHDHVTSVALSLCRIYLSCKDAFPTPQMKSEWAPAVWHEACTKTRVNLDPSMRSELANGSMKLFIDAKKRVTDAVEIFYGFDTMHTSDSVGNNATLAQALLSDKSFVHMRPDLNPPWYPYQHIVIEKAIKTTWFRKRVDDGVVFREYFSPLPVPAIAFALTLIECCIDEWTDGTHQETSWDEERFKIAYQSHVRSLDDFRKLGPAQGYNSFEYIRSSLLNVAR